MARILGWYSRKRHGRVQHIPISQRSSRMSHSSSALLVPLLPLPTLLRGWGKSLVSKYESQCLNCGGKIEIGDAIAWRRGEGAVHRRCPDGTPVLRIPKAPRKFESSQAVVPVTRVDVKKLAQDHVAVYVDGEGNVVSSDVMDDEGKWWPMPRLGTSKLRDESIYTRTSIAHPAKMSPLWAQRMIQEYSKPGDTILDPMAGVGTTGVEASRLGRNAVLVDVEPKWVGQMKANVRRLRQSGLMRGSVRVLRGDARSLDLNQKVDAVMFSPPYLLSEGGPLSSLKTFYRHPDEWKLYDPYTRDRKSDQNIGLSKKEDQYEDLMTSVFGRCQALLKPQGYMVVNMKDKIQDGEVRRMEPIITRIVEPLGFRLVDHKNVEARPGPGRASLEQRNPDMPHVRHETFLVFQRM